LRCRRIANCNSTVSGRSRGIAAADRSRGRVVIPGDIYIGATTFSVLPISYHGSKTDKRKQDHRSNTEAYECYQPPH
jgi:hypothetical protein